MPRYSCVECGMGFEACTPDDQHTIASRDEAEEAIKIKYTCKDCGHGNVIYWYKPAGPIVA